MIDDLIFKGKNVDDAVAKASNFFGVDKDSIEYMELEPGDDGTVAIKLTQNPVAPRRDEHHVETNRYGLLRSESLPKSRNRQYEHPVNSMEEQSKRPVKPKSENHQAAKAQHNRKEGGFKRRQNDSRDRRPGNNGGRKQSFGKKPRQQSNPVVDVDPNWKPTELDVEQMGEFERKAYEFVTGILNNMQMRAEVRPVPDDNRLIMNIDGPDRGLLLNRKGEPLVAIQYLVNKIFLGPDAEEETPVYVDSRGYRVARDEELHDIALASAEKVKRSGREYSLNPMNPYERRQIHIALKDHQDVETVSRGKGYIKKVSILPAR